MPGRPSSAKSHGVKHNIIITIVPDFPDTEHEGKAIKVYLIHKH